MEKTKDIPGWYQRLVSLQTKPASQMTFKQYLKENEAKMKVLYPFLPQDQVKGKLLARWKSHQPQNFDELVRGITKKSNKPYKFPVVNFISKRTNTQAVLTKEPEKTLPDWLTGSAISNKNKKTYKGRAFVLPPKVPEIIHLSQSSNPERSILKSKSIVASGQREKRQPASQVSFTLSNQECQTPLLYTPPTPFALSPVSNEDQTEDALPQKQNAFRPSLPELPVINADHLPDVHSPAQKKIIRSAVENPTGNQRMMKQHRSAQKLADQIQELSLSEQPPKPISKRKPKGKRGKKQKNLPQCCENPVESFQTDYFSSQFLESPKFGPSACEPEKKRDKRFCLFEDEWVKPKNPKKKPRSHSSKSPKVRSKRKLSFSWSPAALGCSQYTPKLKKPMDDLFSSETKTYQRQKKSVVKSKPEKLIKSGKSQERQRKKQTRNSESQKMDEVSDNPEMLRHTERSSRMAKYPQSRTAKRTIENRKTRSKHPPKCLDLRAEEIVADEETENRTRQTELPKAKAPKIKRNSQQNRHDKENHQSFHHDKSLHSKPNENSLMPRSTVSVPLQSENEDRFVLKSRPRLTTCSHEYRKENEEIEYGTATNENSPMPRSMFSAPLQPEYQDDIVLKSRPRLTKNNYHYQKENEEIEYSPAVNAQDSTNMYHPGCKKLPASNSTDTYHVSRKAGCKNLLAPNSTDTSYVICNARHKNPLKEKKTSYKTDNIHPVSPLKPLLPANNRPSLFEPEPDLPTTAEENGHSPALPEEADVLRCILFQLKNTTVPNQSVAPSLPAQSRITEASGVSISSNGPSPSSHRDIRDLMDDLQPLTHFSPKKTLTTVNKGSTFRKRGNILCNMFDASKSDIGVPAKAKRFLPSESCPEESDYSMLFSADVFV